MQHRSLHVLSICEIDLQVICHRLRHEDWNDPKELVRLYVVIVVA